ncbi:queuosine salvage family protein [Burkholderia cenocepacia]|uniref:queuosine salvage family protein n=1 Tax=Burkholderia cenocepacia TaxID=95486 RepID=UPI000760BB97|nr:queuosine salvage family protein [Burkholderia cenocepacia]KWU23356.1 hypothetical protein AS149_37430 [Burkholderia cenocepacia]
MNQIRKKLIGHISALLNPELVFINRSAIEALQPDFSNFELASANVPFTAENPRDAIVYLLAQTALQYRFWDGEGEHYRRYGLDGIVGSAAMVRGFDSAWGEQSAPGSGILACAGATQHLDSYFGDIPDPASRTAILGEILFSPQLQDVVGALDAAIRTGSAGVDEALLVSKAFPRAYSDPFIKKSQLVVGLIIAQYRKAGIACSESLFGFADYQVPAVMRHFGILEYAPELAGKVDSHTLLEKGGDEEHAIRAATVIACEMFAARYGVTAAETDWFFWLRRKAPERPFHLTVTTAY